MKIPLYSSKILTKETALRAIEDTIESSKASRNAVRVKTENELCDVTGAASAVLADNRGDALRNLLYAWSVCKGEAVFVPSFAEPYILFAVLECGAVPVFVDCDRNTWHMSAEKLENAVKKCIKQNELYPRAVIVSDIFGMPFDHAKTADVCAKHGLLLVEDASRAMGARAGDKWAGTLGDAAIISIEGAGGASCGAILTDDVQLARNLRLSAGGGEKISDSTAGSAEIIRKGSVSEIDELTAAILLSELGNAEAKAARRRANAEKLRESAKDTAISLQTEPECSQGAYPVFGACAKDRESAERMVRALREEGIECRMLYSKPLCRNAAFKELDCQASDVPVGSNLSVCTFLLPCHEELTDEQVNYICEKIKVICV